MADQEDKAAENAEKSRDRTKAKKLSGRHKQLFEEAESSAGDFNIGFLSPSRPEPQLTRRAEPLAKAIQLSVAQGNKSGRRFLERLCATNPELQLSEDDQESIIERHKWEAVRRGRRPPLKKQGGSRSKAPTRTANSAEAKSQVPPGQAKAPPGAKAVAAASEVSSGCDLFSAPEAVGSEPARSSRQHVDRALNNREPTPPPRIDFRWKGEGAVLANAFFSSVYRHSEDEPLTKIIDAAIALKADPAALAEVRNRGRREAEYLDQAFANLGLI